jgi:hypothetical protein
MSNNDTEPKPIKTYTRVSRGRRSFQYYALRQGYKWTLSEKSRCWATVMKEAWGGDLDAITLLGIEPKPVERGWHRFAETRELVDLGRRKTDAEGLLKRLVREAETERALRELAIREVRNEATAKAWQHIAEAKELATKHAKAEEQHGVLYALRHGYEDALHAALTAVWSKALVSDMEGVEATATVLQEHVRKAEDLLIDGGGMSSGWGKQVADKVANICYAPALRDWRKWLLETLALHGRIADARQTIRSRELATETKLDNLTQAAGGVSGTQGTS